MKTKLVSIEGERIEALRRVETNSADIVITDPPYNLNNASAEILEDECLRISKGAVIMFSDPLNPLMLNVDQMCFWLKPISTKNTSKRYSRFVEVILIKGAPKWNTGRHWSQYTNMFTDINDETSGMGTMKPQSLLKRLLKNHTDERDMVFDPFTGHGAIKTACDLNNRQYHGLLARKPAK